MRQTQMAILATLVMVMCSVFGQAQKAEVSGTGKTDYIPLWTSASKLGSSNLFQNSSGAVGLGTTSPGATLDVNGSVNAATGYNIGGELFVSGSASTGNAFFGYLAGNTTMTGESNTAVGLDALNANTSGLDNIAIGVSALRFNTTGSGNTAIGGSALIFNTTGSDNTASGYGALDANTSGQYNTADGVLALANNTSANYNTAIGSSALVLNTTGTENTATGAFALPASTTAGENTADGYGALYSTTTGSGNTASGVFALYNNTTGTGNTAFGLSALLNNTTGSSNVAIGVNAGPSAGNLNNTTALGYYSQVSKSNALVLGSTAAQNGAANILVGIDVPSPSHILTVLQGGGSAIADGWATYSSRRWKTNIETLHAALDKVEQLRGVSYDLKESGKHEIGVIAEEVGAVVPEIVSWESNGTDAQGVDYSRLSALLIEAVKQQQQEISALESRLTQLEQDRSQTQMAAARPGR